MFRLCSKYLPSADQKHAVDKILQGLQDGKRDQVLLGVTGSGKTFTMANIIAKSNKPTVIMVHNKTLAAQLYNEMRAFFPENAVEYFVSYFDYYQPESYLPQTDTFIEKDSLVNDKIDSLRHSTLISLLERRDIIVITSVSSIYGIGSPGAYSGMSTEIFLGNHITFNSLLQNFIEMGYKRNDIELCRGNFRVMGDIVEIVPSYSSSNGIRFEFFGDEIDGIVEFDIVHRKNLKSLKSVRIYPNSYYASETSHVKSIVKPVLSELRNRIDFFNEHGKIVEAQRIEQRVRYDMEMLSAVGSLKGIENYSRYIDGRSEGEPPYTLFHYLQENSLLFVDESHVTVGQIGGMYSGDRSRKEKLVDHGFRLPSAKDNRPLTGEEWDKLRCQTVYVSATPGEKELKKAGGEVVEQIIRPTGLLDPVCEVRPSENQIDDIVAEIDKAKEKGLRTMVVVLTKKMAEQVYQYFLEIGVKAMYVHSETDTIERVQIIEGLRSGEYDVLVGINLLREGLDVPECGLVCVIDADKQGFLRSKSSLIQIIGRAARNKKGKVVMYADKITDAMKYALEETQRRREIQSDYNKENNITPQTIIKKDKNILVEIFGDKGKVVKVKIPEKEGDIKRAISELKKQMKVCVENLDFEEAARLRDTIADFSKKISGIKKAKK